MLKFAFFLVFSYNCGNYRGGNMVKNVHIKKGLLVLGLATTLGICSYQLHKHNEVNRVKGYLNDLRTDDNYVDMSRISLDYNIESFNGSTMVEALKDTDIDYVIINDWIIYENAHVGTFIRPYFTNGEIIGYDDNNEAVYNCLKAVVGSNEGELYYEIPEGYYLDERETTAGPHGPMRYEMLKEYDINVYPDGNAYGLSLSKH